MTDSQATPNTSVSEVDAVRNTSNASNNAESELRYATKNLDQKSKEATARGYAPGSTEYNAYVATAQSEVAQKDNNVKLSHEKEIIARNDYNNLAATPEGQDKLLRAGVTTEEIEAMKRVNAGKGSQTDADIVTNAQNRTASGNMKPVNTGFENEGAADGTPFEYQFPTLEAITDFRLRNGFSPYGEKSPDSIARDAMHLQVYELLPQAWKAEKDQKTGLIRNVIDPTDTKNIGIFTIYPNQLDYLQFSHSHSYESSDAIAEVINGALDIANMAESTLNAASNIIGSVKSGMEQDLATRIQRKVETLPRYMGSEKITINIPFVLFTKKDFLRDVFQPLMILTALGYSKRTLGGELGNIIKGFAKDIKEKVDPQNPTPISDNGQAEKQNPAQKEDSVIKKVLKATLGAAEFSGEQLQKLDETLAKTGGIGPFRYFVTQRPEFLSIRHASGLFYFPVVYIKSFNYTFKGPWYNLDGKPIQSGDLGRTFLNGARNLNPGTFGEIFAQAGQSFVNAGQQLGSIFSSSTNPSTLSKLGLPYAYPSMAECTLTVTSALPHFRDDFLQMLKASRTGGEELVSVSTKESGQFRG